jgi:hypothetical protein
MTALLATAGVQAARADQFYVWNLAETTFTGAGVSDVPDYLVTGTITYSADTDAIVDWNITATYLYSSDGTMTSTPNPDGFFDGSGLGAYTLGSNDGIGYLVLTFDGDFTVTTEGGVSYFSGVEGDVGDFSSLSTGHLTFVTSFSTGSSDVPEPASLALFGTGIIVLGAKVRRRLRRDDVDAEHNA